MSQMRLPCRRAANGRDVPILPLVINAAKTPEEPTLTNAAGSAYVRKAPILFSNLSRMIRSFLVGSVQFLNV